LTKIIRKDDDSLADGNISALPDNYHRFCKMDGSKFSLWFLNHRTWKVFNKEKKLTKEVVRAVQAEVIPYDRNLFRTERGLSDSLERLDGLWREVSQSIAPSLSQAVQWREAAAMVATARWMYSSALARKESRGMHKHEDYPDTDSQQQYRLLSGGLDTVWVKPDREVVSRELVTL
jgi:succinate dehydrogenase/fumarate reductase flavoprotein subunit